MLVDPIGESRLPNFQKVDFLSSVRSAPAASGSSPFNVTNNDTVQAMRGTQNAANANNIQAIVAPRVLRFGIRFNW